MERMEDWTTHCILVELGSLVEDSDNEEEVPEEQTIYYAKWYLIKIMCVCLHANLYVSVYVHACVHVHMHIHLHDMYVLTACQHLYL